METDKIIEQGATGKRKRVTAHRSLLPEIIEKMEAKYKGTCTWFGFGQTVHIMRDKKAPLELKSIS